MKPSLIALLIGLLLTLGSSDSGAQAIVCPSNIDFSLGNMANWNCFIGISTSAAPSGIIPAMGSQTYTGPLPGRHTIMSGFGVDPYGGFPVVAPGGGSFSLMLGKDSAHNTAERVQYTLHVPVGMNDYSLDMAYALVFNYNSDAAYNQPAITIRVYDSATGILLPCANLIYTVNQPGMIASPLNSQVGYLPWTKGTINLSGQAGKTLLLEVTALSCAQGNHFAYGYFDILGCGRHKLDITFCNLNSGIISLGAPAGYASYRYYTGVPGPANGYTSSLNNINLLAPSTPTIFYCVLTPFGNNGCTDTIQSRLFSRFTIHVFPKTICGPQLTTTTIGVNVSGGIGGFTWGWQADPCLYSPPGSLGNWTSINKGQVYVYPYCTGGPFIVTVSDSIGCFQQDTVLKISNTQFSMDSLLGRTVCMHDSTRIVTRMNPANLTYSYSWTGQNIPQVLNDSTLASPVYKPFLAGSNQLMVYAYANQCGSVRSIRLITPPDTLEAHDPMVCQGAIFHMPVYDSTGWFSYTWSPLTGITPGQEHSVSPEVTADTSRTYTVTASYPGCPDITRLVSMYAESLPMIDLGPNPLDKPCHDTILIRSSVMQNVPTHLDYNWLYDPGIDSFNLDHVHFSGPFDDNLVLTVSTPLGCSSSDTLHIHSVPGRFARIYPGDTLVCWDNPIQLQASGGVLYHWWPGTFLDDSESASVISTPLNDISYLVEVYDAQNCLDTVSIHLRVHDTARISLPALVQLYDGQVYQFHPKTNGVRFQWYPATGLDDPQSGDPNVSPGVNTLYYVHVTDSMGCTTIDSATVLYHFGETILSLPNAFTPGAAINNVFRVISFGNLSLHYFRIFNRWGNKVFETSDIHQGWDGKYHGTMQETGVFAYELEAVDGSGMLIKKQGNLTLIR